MCCVFFFSFIILQLNLLLLFFSISSILLVLEIVLCVFFPVVLYIGLIDLFSILTFNIKFIRNEASQFFYLFFMNLSQSHDLDCEFNKLTWVGLGPFFWRLLIDFFLTFILWYWVGWKLIYFLWGYLNLLTLVTGLEIWPKLTRFIFLVLYLFLFFNFTLHSSLFFYFLRFIFQLYHSIIDFLWIELRSPF